MNPPSKLEIHPLPAFGSYYLATAGRSSSTGLGTLALAIFLSVRVLPNRHLLALPPQLSAVGCLPRSWWLAPSSSQPPLFSFCVNNERLDYLSPGPLNPHPGIKLTPYQSNWLGRTPDTRHLNQPGYPS